MANPTLLDMPIARDGNKNAIPTTDNGTTGRLSQQYGWQLINAIPPQQGGKAVKREDFNGALYLLSNILFYAQKGWQFEWDANQNYYAGCIVKDPNDGKMYMCLNDITSTTAPHSDTTNWKLWDLSMLANYLPLAGGAMTGAITAPSANAMHSGDDSSEITLWGGAGIYSGGSMVLYGRTRTDGFKGVAQLRAMIEGASKNLLCYPDGRMTWGENDLAGSAIVAKNLSPNGYVKRASGEIIQWGTTGVPRNATEVTVSFPISFSTSYRIVVTSNFNGHPTAVDIDDNGTTLQTKKIVIGTPYDSVCAIHWIAIGY